MSDPEEEENPIVMPQSYTFKEEQLRILQDHVSAIKAAEHKKQRAKLIKAARKEIMDLPESKGLPLQERQDLAIAVDSWFGGRSKRRNIKIKFGKAWTGRLVMYQERKETVNASKAGMFEQAKRKGKEPATAFNFFQKAISGVWDDLSTEEQRDYEKLAKKWNEEGVSREQKQESAMKKAVVYTRKFAEDMYKSLGVRFLFLMAMETPAQIVHTGLLDFNDAIGGGKTYTSEHKNWQTEGIDMDYWNEHNRDYYDPNKIPSDVKTQKVPRGHLTLPSNEYGEPLLPDPLIVPRQENARSWRQNLIRAFLSKHHELASGSRKPIPWKKILPRFRECIEEIYLPNVHLETLAEPSSMRDNQCYTLLKYWYGRQNAGDSPVFQFSHYLQGDDLVEAKDRELLPSKTIDSDSPPPKEISQGTSKSHKQPSGPKVKARRKTMKGRKGRKHNLRRSVSEEPANSSSDEESPSPEESESDDSEESTCRRNTTPISRRRAVRFISPTWSEMKEGMPAASGSPIMTPTPDLAPVSNVLVSSPLKFSKSSSDSGEDMMGPQDLLLTPELQEIADALAKKGQKEVGSLLLQTLRDLRVKSQSTSPAKLPMPPSLPDEKDESRKRQREGSPQPTPPSPTKKSRSMTPAVQRPSSIPSFKMTRSAVESHMPPTAHTSPSKAPLLSKNTVASTSIVPRRRTLSATPQLAVSVDVPRGSRSQTVAAEQSRKRSTRAKPH